MPTFCVSLYKEGKFAAANEVELNTRQLGGEIDIRIGADRDGVPPLNES